MRDRDGMRRVVITGMGWVTPLGSDTEDVWRRLLAGESAVAPIDRFCARTFATNFAAQVKGFRLSDFIDASRHPNADIHSAYALAAASTAWKQAKLDGLGGVEAERAGIYLGAGEGVLDFDAFAGAALAGWNEGERRLDAAAWARTAYERMTPERELEQEPNFALTHIAEEFGLCGPSFNCMTACAASTQAVGEAYELIRKGDADLMLTGGTHSMIHPLGMTGFIRLTAMSTRRDDYEHAARPFDSTRDGFVMGEGAGVLILETIESARKRGAEILAEVVGYGSSADAFRITDIQPDGKGGQAAMEAALDDAGIDPKKPGPDGRAPVQYISAHGTGTQENDSIETRAVKATFADQAPRIPFSSVKSMMGHLIQAAGAVELMTCVQAIRTGFVPPTISLRHPDPNCDLDYVANEARDLNDEGGVTVAMSNGFGFGGQNDTVVVRRFEP